MVLYSRNIRTSGTGSGAPVVELIGGSLRPCKLLEVGIILVNATASVFALGRPAAIGVTPTTPVNLLSQHLPNSNMSDAKLAVAWGTPPTQPAAFFRSGSLGAVAGASLNPTWTFDNGGLTIPVGGSIILWTLTTVSIADVFFVISE